MFYTHRKGHCGPRAYYGIWLHGGGRARWGRGPGGSEGGRRRVFDTGELRLVLLKLISDEPRHGYDLIRAIETLTGGAYAPSAGVVYPTLTLLEDMGLIVEAKSEGAKKQFAITEAGQGELAEKAELVAALIARLSDMGAARARTDATPVRRAMSNLRTVLQNRLSDDDVSPSVLHDVAAILDEAAQRIERL